MRDKIANCISPSACPSLYYYYKEIGMFKSFVPVKILHCEHFFFFSVHGSGKVTSVFLCSDPLILIPRITLLLRGLHFMYISVIISLFILVKCCFQFSLDFSILSFTFNITSYSRACS